MKFFILVVGVFVAISASAAGVDVDASLRLDADLILHPKEVGEVLESSLTRFSHQSSFKATELKIEKPYHVSLSNVEAVGPWDLQWDVSRVSDREFGFTFLWPNPVVKVGALAIQDTVSRVVDGVPIQIHLDGICEGLRFEMPGGALRVSGRMRWDVLAGRLVPDWNAFELLAASPSAPGEVAIESCRGPSVIQSSIRELFARAGSDRAWFESLLKQGLLEVARAKFEDLTVRILERHEFSVFDPMVGAWVPGRLSAIADGKLRVEGQFVLSVPGSELGDDHVERGYDPRMLGESPESGFMLPKNSLERVLQFMYVNGLLQYRLSSSDVQSFRSLMWNRLAQFFVWPDLMSFARETQFYFYLSARSAPQLSEAQPSASGGLVQGIAFPLSAQQWAPVANVGYVPYLNFQTQIYGQLSANISAHRLSVRLMPYDFKLNYNFASEFQRYRRVNSRMSIGLIGSKVREYLGEKSFDFVVPAISLTEKQTISIREIQVESRYLRLPLMLEP